MSKKFKTSVEMEQSLKLSSQTNSRALALDSSGNLVSSTTTDTELSYLSGVTSSIQTQIGNKISSSEKGANNGVATLDAGGKIPVAQLPNSVMEYKGNWNASTNSPSLADGTGNAGDVYRVDVAGSQNLGSGSISFAVGDWVVYNGTIWEKSLNSNAVVSVNGETGIVSLDASDLTYTQADVADWTVADGSSIKATLDEVGDRLTTIEAGGSDTKQVKVSANDTTEGYLEDKIVGSSGKIVVATLNDAGNEDLQISIGADVFDKTVDDSSDITEGSNLFFTDERAQDAVGTILTDSATIDLTYNDGSNTISADLILNGQTQISEVANADELLIYDVSGSVVRKATREQILKSSAGDILEASFAGANNQITSANVTGLSFSTSIVRGFKAYVTVVVDATAALYEIFELECIQKGGVWDMSVSATGDNSLVVFSITNAGQVQYTSGNYSGFVSLGMKFRAITLSV
jgi:hypothetical protein